MRYDVDVNGRLLHVNLHRADGHFVVTVDGREWTIDAADETPNLTGSPGLFGNATDAELFIDNVSVTPNAK